MMNKKIWSEYIVPCTLRKLLHEISKQNTFSILSNLYAAERTAVRHRRLAVVCSATRARRCVVLDLPALEMDARSRTGNGPNLSLFFVPSGARSISLAFGQAQGHPTSRDSILSHTAADPRRLQICSALHWRTAPPRPMSTQYRLINRAALHYAGWGWLRGANHSPASCFVAVANQFNSIGGGRTGYSSDSLAREMDGTLYMYGIHPYPSDHHCCCLCKITGRVRFPRFFCAPHFFERG